MNLLQGHTAGRNKLMGEFMGGEFNNSHPEDNGVFLTSDFRTPTIKQIAQWRILGSKEVDFFSIGRMRYHESWDWIIPVIKKAKSLKIEDGILKDDSVKTYVDNLGKINRALLKLDKEATVLAIVQFIIWYHENKKK